ncbi:MAG: hypothetical protein ABEJ06_00285 [Haloarculaceae archaeon]
MAKLPRSEWRLELADGPAVELDRQPLDGDGWEEVGTVTWAAQP